MRKDFEAVIKEGADVDISQISACSYKSMDECEQKCPKYYSCQTIALANDLLVAYEDYMSENK